jgi:3,4-dihydroxy 2-butanone 4-phosphate synthase/GTP cyclohydrolase II
MDSLKNGSNRHNGLHRTAGRSWKSVERQSEDGFSTVEMAVRDIRNGRMVIVVDDPGRENEGDLVCAAEKATPEIINFMAIHGRGLICLPIVGDRLDQLGIDQMVLNPNEARDA